jgi:hypothetical protein
MCAAFQALAFSLLDLLLTWLVFLYLRNKQIKQLGVVYFIHLTAGCMVSMASRISHCAEQHLLLLCASMNTVDAHLA